MLIHMAQDSSPGTPVFVFLSPGVDVAASVEALGRKYGMTADNNKYFAVSLGQGQVGICVLVQGLPWDSLMVELSACASAWCFVLLHWLVQQPAAATAFDAGAHCNEPP